MLCERCHKREAEVMLTVVSDSKESHHYFCHECVSEIYFNLQNEQSPLKLQSLLQLLVGDKTLFDNLECPHCHTKFSDYKKTGRVGCSQCYDAFESALHLGSQPELLSHKNLPVIFPMGTGKSALSLLSSLAPMNKETQKKASMQDEKTLENIDNYFSNNNFNENTSTKILMNMQNAVKDEDYEQAAKLRDKLRRISKTSNSEGDKA